MKVSGSAQALFEFFGYPAAARAGKRIATIGSPRPQATLVSVATAGIAPQTLHVDHGGFFGRLRQRCTNIEQTVWASTLTETGRLQ